MDLSDETRKAGEAAMEVGALLVRVSGKEGDTVELKYQYKSLKELAAVLKDIQKLVETLANVTLVGPMFTSQEKHGV